MCIVFTVPVQKTTDRTVVVKLAQTSAGESSNTSCWFKRWFIIVMSGQQHRFCYPQHRKYVERYLIFFPSGCLLYVHLITFAWSLSIMVAKLFFPFYMAIQMQNVCFAVVFFASTATRKSIPLYYPYYLKNCFQIIVWDSSYMLL